MLCNLLHEAVSPSLKWDRLTHFNRVVLRIKCIRNKMLGLVAWLNRAYYYGHRWRSHWAGNDVRRERLPAVPRYITGQKIEANGTKLAKAGAEQHWQQDFSARWPLGEVCPCLFWTCPCIPSTAGSAAPELLSFTVQTHGEREGG